jgi:hypothetical protein
MGFSENVARRASMTDEELRAELKARVEHGLLVLPDDPSERVARIAEEILLILHDKYERCNLETQ